ncbi:MAG: hypothetical protein K1W26_18970, partial [Acetatifactor sp.]
GVDIKALVHGMRPQPEGSREERIESGRRVLMNHLQARGITDNTVQQEICDLVIKEQPYMLENLYMADFCGSEDIGEIYEMIMEYYDGYKHEKELVNAEELLDSYLTSKGYTNPVERQFVIFLIKEMREQQLLELYEVNAHSLSSYIQVAEKMEKFYAENKENIGLEVLEERFRNDKNADQYSVVCGYLELLVALHYICKAEYDKYVNGMPHYGGTWSGTTIVWKTRTCMCCEKKEKT